MGQSSLEQFGAYQKARELFDLVVADMDALKADSRCYRLITQQVASADSVCANIEEGYGRQSRVEYVRFLDIARGSARETRGRYERMKHWLSQDVIIERIKLIDEIIGILTSSIVRMRQTYTNAFNILTFTTVIANPKDVAISSFIRLLRRCAPRNDKLFITFALITAK